jgi:antitoxin VapB
MPSRRGDPQPEAPRRARLFRNGRNQALRIPRELEFPGDEVILHKEDDRLIVEPVARRRTLAEILPELKPLTEGFPEPADPPAQREDIF